MNLRGHETINMRGKKKHKNKLLFLLLIVFFVTFDYSTNLGLFKIFSTKRPQRVDFSETI